MTWGVGYYPPHLVVNGSYDKFSKFYSRAGQRKEQNLTRDNRTQGIMEKSQQELKRTRCHGRRFRGLHEFAQVYNEEHIGLIREFKDGVRLGNKRVRRNTDTVNQEEEQWRKRSREETPDTSIGKYLQAPPKELRGSQTPVKSRKRIASNFIAAFASEERNISQDKKHKCFPSIGASSLARRGT